MFIGILKKTYDVTPKQIIMIKHFERLLNTAMNNIRVGNLVLKCHLKLVLCARHVKL